MKNPPEENQLTPGQGLPAPVCCAMAKPLRVPKRRPKQWEVGDVAIKYITLRRDDDPEPPCIIMLVTAVVGEKCECAHLDMNYTEMIEARYLLSVEDAVAHFERLANDGTMTFRYHRIGLQKLEDLARPFKSRPEWVKLIKWWDENPEDQPDGFPVMREMILHNTEGLAGTAGSDPYLQTK
jgi:hypothetical protein